MGMREYAAVVCGCIGCVGAFAATPETSRHFVKFTDPQSGAVSYLLEPGRFAFNQQSIYFTNKSMTDDGRFLIFDGSNDERDRKVNHLKRLWCVDFEKDEVRQFAVIGGKIPFLDTRTGEVYWIDGNGVHRLDLRKADLKEEIVCRIPPELMPKKKGGKARYCTHLTLTADRSGAFLDACVEGKYVQGMLDLKTGKWSQWTDADFMCNHGQINPCDDKLALVAQEYGSSLTLNELGRELRAGEEVAYPPFVTSVKRPTDTVYPRLWLCRPGRKTMVPPLIFNYATHENFTADGKGFYYCAKGVVLCDIGTGRQRLVDPVMTQHATMSSDLRYVTGDCSRDGWWRGCAWTCMFWNRDTHRGMYIFSKRPRLNTRENQSKLHPDPHPHFVCRDRYIISTMIGEDKRMNLCVTPVAPLIEATSDPATAPKVVRMPLEWSARFPTDAPYEVEIDNKRLIGLGVVAKPFASAMEPATAFAVEAEVGGNRVRVPVTGLKGRTISHLRLRFSPPAGTTSLTLLGDVSERFEIEDSKGCDNMLAGMLDEANLGRWACDPGVNAKILRVRDGILLDGGQRSGQMFEPAGAYFMMDVPEGAAGKPVFLELDVRSLAPETWPNHIRIRQFDADGHELAESVVDPRWLSHMRPPEKTCFFREGGRLHPAASKVKLDFGLRWDVSRFGSDGKPATPDRFRPRLLISHAAMRIARSIPFPGLEKGIFSTGVSGEKGDEALNIGTNRVFFYQTRSQASWAEAIDLRREQDCFYPFAAGTLEAWFKPDFENLKSPYPLFDAAHYVARAEGGPKWPIDRGDLLLVTYHPGSQKLALSMKDRADKIFKTDAKVPIPDAAWSHVAVTFDPGSEARVYVNGRCALTCPLKGFVPYDPAHAKVPNDDGPVEVYAGSSFRTVRDADMPRARQNHPALNGAIDLMRVSSGVRYSGEFDPPRTFAMDGDTRALFLFDRSFDGASGGGIGFIPGSAWSMSPRTSRTLVANGREYPYFPSEIPQWNNPDKVFKNLNYPVVPSDSDLRLAWKPHTLEFDVKAGDRKSVTAPKGVVTDSIEIHNTGGEPLAFPALLNGGETDARSYADIAKTLRSPDLSDNWLANRIFGFMLRSSDYFMHHVPTFNVGSDEPRSVEYDALFMLNSYCGFECGPLNNLTANVFAHAGHLPAVRTGGYGHEFEGVFFDSMNHIYDLSARKFFPAYDNVNSAGLREADDEPGLLTRYGGRTHAFTRKSHRYHVVQRPYFQEKVGPVLNPGERFVASFANDGHVNFLQLNPCFPGCRKTLNRPLKPYKWDCAEAVHAKLRKGQELCRVERWFPDYGNAFVIFDGRPVAGNPAFTNVTADSFAYSVKSAYPIVWADYRAELEGGGTAPLEISTGRGRTWRTFAVPAEMPVMGRLAYLVRVKAPIGKVARFRAVTESQFNPRVFPGRLRAGANNLEFRVDCGKVAHVAIRYREPAGRISVSGAVAWGAIPGFGRRLVTLDPSVPSEFAVKGLGPNATVRTYGLVSASLSGGKLAIAAAKEGKFPAFATVTLCDGEASQDLLVLVADGVRLALPPKPAMLKTKTDVATFTYPKLPAGRYVVLQLERFMAGQKLSSYWGPNLDVLVAGQKKPQPAGGVVSMATDFWKCTMGTPGGGRRANWKWDYAIEPESTYPYALMREWDMPESEKVEYSLRQPLDGGVELAAALILPAPDASFRAELIKMLDGFRTMPPGTVNP